MTPTQRAAMEQAEQWLAWFTEGTFSNPHPFGAADVLLSIRAALAEPVAWQPIETAPKGQIVLVHYKNSLGNGRTMRARYYLSETLDSDSTESGWADEGWYEESEAYEYLMPLDHEPTHWMPLPAAPGTAPQPPAPAVDYKPLTDPHDHPEPHSYKWTQSEMDYINKRVAAAIAAHEAKRGKA